MDVSVILATYNRAAILRETLERFRALQAGALRWELLVVDNRSSDATPQVLAAFQKRLPLVPLWEPRRGKNHALNAALGIARGQIVVFTDDDVTPDPGWLTQIWLAICRWPTHQAFGGKILPRFPPDVPPFLQQADFSTYAFAIHDLAIPESPYPPDGSPAGPNCWFRRSLFDSGIRFNGGIGPQGRSRVSGSELELFARLKNEGITPVYVPRALVHHRIQRSQTRIAYLLRRSYASGRGFMRIYGAPAGARRVAGVPRYLFRQLAESAWSSLDRAARTQLPASFAQVMHCAQFLGCIREARHQYHLSRTALDALAR